MNDIGVGDRVVCVDDGGWPQLMQGEVYTIGEVFTKTKHETAFCNVFGIDTEGDGGWYITRFRKCRPTNIDEFLEIAKNPELDLVEV